LTTINGEGLPEGWASADLRDVATMRLGKMLDAAKQGTGERLPYLRNVNLRWNSFDLSDLRTMTFNEDEMAEFDLRPGDVRPSGKKRVPG
jgi:type I restriction enzyme S subunit